MAILDGKTALICGVANERSIAWGISEAFKHEGAELAFTYAVPTLEKRVRPLAESVGATFIEECDVSDDVAIDAMYAKLKEQYGTIDILIHAIAFAEREDLAGRFVDTSRAGFLLAQDISVYSLVALTRGAMPLMPEGGSILSLTYYGAEKVVPHYNVMGVAKAALESSVRYLASDLGPDGIRVNAISAGPIRTLSASGIKGFRDMQRAIVSKTPLRRNVTVQDVGSTAAFLCSNGAAGITGEITYVDAGFNTVGMHLDDD